MELMKADKFSRAALIITFIIMTLFLLASGAPAYSVSKVPAVLLLVLLIYAIITGKYNNLPKNVITPVVISVAAYIIIYAISLFYATTGQFALTVFSYYLGGVSVFFLTLLLVNKSGENTRILLTLLSSSIGIGGIFSIDAASIRILTPALEKVLLSLLNLESISLGVFETGTRMTSIINNPNVFGSLAALGIFAAAYLFLSSSSKNDFRISSGLLIINAVSLLYCFSLGSLIGMFFAVVVFLAFAGKELRPKVVYVTLTTIIVSFISVFIGFAGMGKSSAIALLPLTSLLIFGVVLHFLLGYADNFTAKIAIIGGNKISIILLVVVLLITALSIAALNISKPYTFGPTDTVLRRAVTLEPGDYQLALDASDDKSLSNALIESQNYDQASTHTSAILFKGFLENGSASFTVPIDSNICFINITGVEGAVIEKIDITNVDGKIIESVNPDYLLLPTFMASRLQGIFVNENAAQRFVFFKDGLKIAAMSPIIGHGPGAFESNILSVQDYYYVTRGAHNHYIQTLDEVGVVGLLAFISIILFSIFALFKKLRTAENRALFSALSAMLIMIIIHTAIEVTFIYGIYNIVTFAIIGLISSNYSQKELSAKDQKKAPTLPAMTRYGALGICIVLLLINIGQLAAINTVKAAGNKGDVLEFLDALALGSTLDFTNDVSYKTSFISTYSLNLPEEYYIKSEGFAQDLKKHNSFGTLTELVNYYIKTGNNEEAYQTLNSRQALLRYDADAWNQTFDFYRAKMEEASSAADPAKEAGLVSDYAGAAFKQLDTYLAESPLDIPISEENEAFRAIL